MFIIFDEDGNDTGYHAYDIYNAIGNKEFLERAQNKKFFIKRIGK